MFRYMNDKRKKGQSTLEYAVLIIIIIGALISIQVYIKRGIQGRLKSAADDIGDQFSVGNTNARTEEYTYSETLDTFINGETKSVLKDDEINRTSFNYIIENTESEFWGIDE